MSKRIEPLSRGKRKNHRYGDLVKHVAESTGRSRATVYSVLLCRMRSRPVQDAIDEYFRALEAASAGGKGIVA